MKTQETASVQMWWFIRLLGEKGAGLIPVRDTNPLYVGSGRACGLTLPNQTQATPGRAPVTREQLKVPTNT